MLNTGGLTRSSPRGRHVCCPAAGRWDNVGNQSSRCWPLEIPPNGSGRRRRNNWQRRRCRSTAEPHSPEPWSPVSPARKSPGVGYSGPWARISTESSWSGKLSSLAAPLAKKRSDNQGRCRRWCRETQKWSCRVDTWHGRWRGKRGNWRKGLKCGRREWRDWHTQLGSKRRAWFCPGLTWI